MMLSSMRLTTTIASLRTMTVGAVAAVRDTRGAGAAITFGAVPQQQHHELSNPCFSLLRPSLTLYSSPFPQRMQQQQQQQQPWIRLPTASRRLTRPLPFTAELQWQGRVNQIDNGSSAAVGFLPVALLRQVRQTASALLGKRKAVMCKLLQDLRRHEFFLRPHRMIVRQQFAAAVPKLLRKHYQNRVKVTKDDKYALEDYTGPGYGVMNRKMRPDLFSDDIAGEEIMGRIQAVLRALTKKLSVHKGIVYRGMAFPEDAEVCKRFLAKLQVGATFEDAGFLSTTKKEAITAQFGGDRNILFVIHNKTGVDVSKYSRHPDEEEVLFAPKTLFRIIAVEHLPSGAIRVTMEEIPKHASG